MNRKSRVLASAVIGVVANLMFVPVRADEGKATAAQVDSLVEDINAHKQLCGSVTKKQKALYRQCKNEQASLLARQKQLGVSNHDLNTKLSTRGWRWP